MQVIRELMRDRHLFTHRTWWFAGIEQKAPQSTYQYWLAPEVGWDGFEVEMVCSGTCSDGGRLVGVGPQPLKPTE